MALTKNQAVKFNYVNSRLIWEWIDPYNKVSISGYDDLEGDRNAALWSRTLLKSQEGVNGPSQGKNELFWTMSPKRGS